MYLHVVVNNFTLLSVLQRTTRNVFLQCGLHVQRAVYLTFCPIKFLICGVVATVAVVHHDYNSLTSMGDYSWELCSPKR